jgi:hypothetical protein
LLVRLDAAGQYADNLLPFLHRLSAPPADVSGAHPGGAPAFTLTLCCGDPQRNKNYRAAPFGNQKSAPLEARACARYALSERPAAAAFRRLRQVAGRLQAVVRQHTRLVNQFHPLLALTFSELALVTWRISR